MINGLPGTSIRTILTSSPTILTTTSEFTITNAIPWKYPEWLKFNQRLAEEWGIEMKLKEKVKKI